MTDFERQGYNAMGIPQFIDYFGDRFNDMATREVYAEYLKFWDGVQTSKIAFSRYIVRFTKYKTKLVSRNGKKMRVFVVALGSR